MERDKRKFKRFDAYMSVKFTGTESTSVKGIGLSRDLCREGLKINSDKSLQEGTPLDLEITIPDDPKPIFSSGLVMWSRPSEGFDHMTNPELKIGFGSSGIVISRSNGVPS